MKCSKTAVAALLRISWRTVGWILVRVAHRLLRGHDCLAGLRRIGIDEISFRRGQRYLLIVVDHDRKRLAAEGRDRGRQLTHNSADGANWIATVVAARCPQAVLCLDPFHVVAWATAALDEIRREVWNQARREGRTTHATWLQRTRWALWKNADDLTRRQRAKLAWVQRVNQPLYRA